MENNNVDTTKTINHLSLCSGYEGIGLGLRRVLPNLREIAYVEREGFPVANLVAKMEAGELDAAPVFTDVKTFPYGEFRGCVDILSGGFPCQPFSSAGKRNSVEDPRHLFPYIADGIRECQPRIVFLENVEGIISAKTADGESVLQYVLRELEGLGYRATAGVFSAAEVGAPHQRKRVFILAYSATVGIQRSGRPNKEGSSHTIEGCGDGASSTREELGNTEHNGCAAQQELRGDEEASDQWRKEESSKTRESEGASRPIDVPSVQGCTEGSKSEELAHPHSSESSKGRGDNGEVPEVSSVKRADLGPSLPRGEGDQRNSELAHPTSRQPRQSQAWNRGQDTSGGSEDTQWPARPSEPQHDWEEPRVTAVAGTKSQQSSSSNHRGESGATGEQEKGELGRGDSGSLRQGTGQAELGLGRATNGSANRVDRLRLLGNGVVPATAAKAFVTLINRIYKHD